MPTLQKVSLKSLSIPERKLLLGRRKGE